MENQKCPDYYSIMASSNFQDERVNTTELLWGFKGGFLNFQIRSTEGYSQFL